MKQIFFYTLVFSGHPRVGVLFSQFVTVSYSGSIVHTLTEEVPNYYSHIPVLMILGQFTVSITYDLLSLNVRSGPVILSIVSHGKAYMHILNIIKLSADVTLVLQ